MERDSRVIAELAKMGWRVVVIWECETMSENGLRTVLLERLAATSHRAEKLPMPREVSGVGPQPRVGRKMDAIELFGKQPS
jgi:hypothetical protein